MPDASSQMPEASQGAINLLTEQILKGGVPLFEERGTAFRFVVFRINIFRANDFLLELSFSGGGEFSTWALERRETAGFIDTNLPKTINLVSTL